MGFAGRRNGNRGSFSYLLEFVIIIAGIMVSFLLNEWRENNREQEKKYQLLLELNQDLAGDSVHLEASIKLYKGMLRGYDSLLKNPNAEFNEDSLNFYVDRVTSYYVFQGNKSTYLKLNNDPNIVLNKQDSLLETFLVIHDQLYRHLQEWSSIDKRFVLDQLLPYMDLHAPFYYPPPPMMSFQGKVFYELKKEDAFMNLLKSGRTYKGAMVQVLNSCLGTVSKFKQQIRAKLKQVEK